MLTNLLVYMPLGLAISIARRGAKAPATTLAIATAGGFLLSLVLETIQAYLPGRTTSLVDLGLNTAGSLVGALLARVFERNRWAGVTWSRWRNGMFVTGIGTDIALVALGFWALSQLTPFVPSIDIGNLRHGLSPLRQAAANPSMIDAWKTAVYGLMILGFGSLVTAFALDRRRAIRWYVLFVCTVLLLKVPIVMRQLSAEALMGAAGAFALLFAMRRLPRPAPIALLALAAAVVVGALRPEPNAASLARDFGWTLFASQMLSINGLQDILETAAPPLALAAIGMRADPRRLAAMAWGGGVLVLVSATALEWAQQFVPGRVPEISDIVVAVGAWCAAWIAATRTRQHSVLSHQDRRSDHA
jgi:VanZ family protein